MNLSYFGDHCSCCANGKTKTSCLNFSKRHGIHPTSNMCSAFDLDDEQYRTVAPPVLGVVSYDKRDAAAAGVGSSVRAVTPRELAVYAYAAAHHLPLPSVSGSRDIPQLEQFGDARAQERRKRASSLRVR
jgi:hypothetical protein